MQKVDQFTLKKFAQKSLLKLHIVELFSGHFVDIKNQICPKCHLYITSEVLEEWKAKFPVFGFKSYTQQSRLIHFASSPSFLIFCFPWPIFP